MPLSFQVVALASQLIMVADEPPNFDMGKTCKLDLAAAYGQDTGDQYKSCINDEENARKQVQNQWPKVPGPARESCASQESVGGTPSYVSLLTCLQMSSWK